MAQFARAGFGAGRLASNSTKSGNGWLLASSVTVAPEAKRVKPKYSSTVPLTSTWSPTVTVGAPACTTKMPSEVSGSLSLRLAGVCMKKPPAPTAVTMLSFVVTDSALT